MSSKTAFAFGAGFRSLTQETESPLPLPVRGALPAWLTGTLLRTGPSKFEVGERTYNHWFDGLAMLHRFAFGDGQVTYSSCFLQSNAFTAAMETGKISYGEFATDPCRTLFGRVAAIFDPKLTANCNVNVSDFGGEIVALTETTLPMRFAPDTLETLGVFGYAPPLAGQVSNAHPHYDVARKRHYSYMVAFGMESRYLLFSIGDDGAQAQVAELPVDRPAYMHSFAMSENYLALVEFPLTVSALELKFSGKPFIRNYRWQPERGLKFTVVEKNSGRTVATALGEAAFAFHHVNAFEDGGDLVIDLIAYENAEIIDALYLAKLRANTPLDATGRLVRYRVPLVGGPVARETLASVALELPRINYKAHAGKPYRYVWGTGIEVKGDFLDSILKVDIETGTVARWYEPGLYPGEPVFVPAPSAQAEDEGVLLSVVLDVVKDRSFLLVLDARTLEEKARAEAPHAIPFHFHGNYFATIPGETSR
ncbi:MAG: carotenoid oxygenase family protein [Methyloceanibacter sp.]|uniref:carotenoid oxygenase family protein n=1 Tax=Methyloceanibacter sp. TaxID=1965321 RepID=UPI003D6CDD0C